ncbi:MAG: dienelactone hydrolase family protein, partial [Candidatus Eremiobacteraeota bacterium]|nr:dienelactone hydrolase family protein [Candidatus Eremiobacteraeota bacterium]
FYGIHPNVHPALDQLRAPVLGHFGRDDRSIPLDRIETLFTSIRERGVPAQEYVYDAGHAFANDTRPEAYNAAAADEAWRRTFAFFDAHLRHTSPIEASA